MHRLKLMKQIEAYLVTILLESKPSKSIFNLGVFMFFLSNSKCWEFSSKTAILESSKAKEITKFGTDAVLTLLGPILYLKVIFSLNALGWNSLYLSFISFSLWRIKSSSLVSILLLKSYPLPRPLFIFHSLNILIMI